MKTRKTLLFWIIMLYMFSGGVIKAQKAVFTGKVTDIETGIAINNVGVALFPGNTGTTTNTNGSFTIENLGAGTFKVTFSHISYKSFEMEVTLKNDERKEIAVTMETKIYKLDEFAIKGSLVKEMPYIKNTVIRENIEEQAAHDIGDYLRTIPNVSAIKKGGVNLDPVVRGFKFSQLNVIINGGVKIEGGCPNRMDPTASHIDMDAIEAIEVIKGPYALRYGPSFGGVVNLITTNPKPYDKFEIHARGIKGYESNWNSNKEHLTVFGGNKYVFFALEGNNQQGGNYLTGDDLMVKSAYRKFSYSGKLGFAPAKNHKILFSYQESYGRDILFAALPMDERDDDTKVYSMDYTARNVTKMVNSIDMKVYYSDVNHLMDNLQRSISDTVAADAYVEADKLGYRAEVGLNVAKGHLYFGTDYYNIKKDGVRTKTMIGQDPMNGAIRLRKEQLWHNAEITNIGIFTEYKRKFGSWDAVGAFRMDLNDAHSDSIGLTNMTAGQPPILDIDADSTISEFTNYSFSVGVKKHITDNLSLSFSAGRGVRSPDMLERFIITLPVGFDSYEYMGNALLKPEANNEVDLTLNYKIEKIGAVEFNVFYSVVNDYITGRVLPKTEQLPMVTGSIGVKEFYNAGNATFNGFEFSFATPEDYEWGASVTAAYTAATLDKAYQYVYDVNNNVTEIKELKDDPLNEIPPMVLNLNLNYKLLNNKLIPRIHVRYSADQKNVSVAFNERTTPSFTLLDFGLTYKYNNMVTVNGGVNNILDKAYYEHLNRRVTGSLIDIYEPGRVFFVNLIINI